MLMYAWDSAPRGQSGVSASRERAKAAATAALLGSQAFAAVVVTEVHAILSIAKGGAVYEPTGRTWTGRREGAGVAWTAAMAVPESEAVPA